MIRKLSIGTTATAAAVFALAFLLPRDASAAKVEEKNYTVKGEVTAVDLKTKAITLKVEAGAGEGKDKTVNAAHSFKMEKDGQTTKKDGKPWTIRDLKQGDVVNLTYRKVMDPKTKAEELKLIKVIVLSSAESASTAPAGAAAK